MVVCIESDMVSNFSGYGMCIVFFFVLIFWYMGYFYEFVLEVIGGDCYFMVGEIVFVIFFLGKLENVVF